MGPNSCSVPITLVCGTILPLTKNQRLTPAKNPCQSYFGFGRFLDMPVVCHRPSSLLKNPLGRWSPSRAVACWRHLSRSSRRSEVTSCSLLRSASSDSIRMRRTLALSGVSWGREVSTSVPRETVSSLCMGKTRCSSEGSMEYPFPRFSAEILPFAIARWTVVLLFPVALAASPRV